MTVNSWWLPFALATATVWVAIGWPLAIRQHTIGNLALPAACLLTVAVVTPITFIAGPHFDPRIAVDPDTIAFPGWLAWTKQAINLLLLVCACVAVTTRTGRRRPGVWLLVAFTVFNAIGILSATIAGNGMRSALIAALAVAPVTVFWSSAGGWASTVPVLRWALRAVVWPSAVLAVANPGWAYWPPGFGRELVGLPQLVGATEHPNALGPTAGLLLILEIARPRHRRWLPYAVIAAGVLALAQSRTAWFAVAVALLFAAAAGRRGWLRWAAVTGAAALLLWLRASPPDVDFTGRPAVWAYAWKVFRAHPLIGDGPGFIEIGSRSGVLPPDIGWQPRHAHDQVLQTAAATGVLGLVALLLLAVLLAVAAGRTTRVTGGASVALLGALVSRSITEVPLTTGVTGFLLNLVLFAAIFAGLRDRQDAGWPPVAADGSAVDDLKYHQAPTKIGTAF